MWRESKNSVGKMFKTTNNSDCQIKTLGSVGSYPQFKGFGIEEICSTRSVKNTMHIFTPLIVLINFYI